jgi:hypothetical protein
VIDRKRLYTIEGRGRESPTFSPDGKRLAVYGPKLFILDARSGAIQLEIEVNDFVGDIRFSHDGGKIAVATDSGIRIFSTRSGAELVSIRVPLDGSGGIDFSPDDSRIVAVAGRTLGDDNFVAVFSATTGEKLVGMQRTGGILYSPTFSLDGTMVAGAGSVVALWDARTGKLKARRDVGHFIDGTEFLPDGKGLLLYPGEGHQPHGRRRGGQFAPMRWELRRELLTGDALISEVCGSLLKGSLSRFTQDELMRAPMLDARLDQDACKPASGWRRFSLTLGAGLARLFRFKGTNIEA